MNPMESGARNALCLGKIFGRCSVIQGHQRDTALLRCRPLRKRIEVLEATYAKLEFQASRGISFTRYEPE